MKLAFLIGVSVLALSSNSNAAPQTATTNSAVPAVATEGTAIFDGHVFQYRITDRGVRTSGQIFPKPAILTSERNYVLSYQAKGDVTQEQLVTLADAIRADGGAKCKELSDVEFATFQKSDASEAVKKSAGQLTEFTGRSSLELRADPSLIPGFFICNAVIKVQIN